MTDTLDLYTTLKNTAGKSRVFGYIPPHGKTLLAGQQVSVFGDIADQISIAPRGNRRKKEALERDLLEGRITILKTPPPILYDQDPDDALLADPSVQATVSTSGGGTVTALATGNYKIAYTFVTADGGETLVGSSLSASFALTQGSSKPRVTIDSLPAGAVSANLYLTAVGAAAGSERLYAVGVTGTTYDLVALAPSFTVVPVSNTAVIADPDTLALVDVDAGGDTGGLLQAGVYYLTYTWVNANGETLESPEAGPFTVVASHIPMITIPELPAGATGANIYLTAAAGGTGAEKFYKLVAGGGQIPLEIATHTTVDPTTPTSAYFSAPAGAPIIDVISNAKALVAGEPLVNREGIQFEFLQPPQTGGNMTIGKYYAKFTYVANGDDDIAGGETTGSPESLQFEIVTDGQIPVVKFPFSRLPQGILSVNLYVTAPNGAAASEKLVMTGIKNNVVLLINPSEGSPEPQLNTTGLSRVVVPVVGHGVLGVADPSWGGYKPVP
jgi:hypothetical protein